jgi:hypothetical protein
MTDPYSQKRLYRTQREAVRSFDDGDTDGNIAFSQYKFTVRSLAPCYYIRYHILVAGAMDNWEDADYHRLAAVKLYPLPVEHIE